MLQTLKDLRETNIVGPNTRQWGLSADACPALATFHIRGLGIGSIGEGYRIVRTRPPFAHINVCLEGAGRVLVNGQWIRFPAGTAALFPREYPHGGEWGGEPWRMSWVLYDGEPVEKAVITATRTTLVRTDPRPFEWALLGLYNEVNGPADTRLIEQWVKLIHLQVGRIAGAPVAESRLTALWEQVDADLAFEWTAAELSRLAKMSEVHLRRLSHAEIGRSPMQQVTYLRMRRASYLLESQAQTVEAVAWTVGYRSVSAFTSAFKQWIGRMPRRSNDH